MWKEAFLWKQENTKLTVMCLMTLGAQVNRLSGPYNTGRKCLNRSYCDHLAEVSINMLAFCLRGFGKHSCKNNTITSENEKGLKMAMVKDLMRVHYKAVDKQIWLFL